MNRDIPLIALFAALIVALGLIPPIPLPFIPVPITLQSMGVMLAGLVLGPVRGLLAVLVVIVLVGIGLPVLSGGRGGLAVFSGPTAGFLFGWLAAAYVTGALVRGTDPDAPPLRRALPYLAASIVGGILVLYACGITWLALGPAALGFQKAALGSLAFIPGDIVKAVAASLVASGVERAYPLARR
jgi:biotin transport system substrate-specific component